jgi:hypothetical protein
MPNGYLEQKPGPRRHLFLFMNLLALMNIFQRPSCLNAGRIGLTNHRQNLSQWMTAMPTNSIPNLEKCPPDRSRIQQKIYSID